MGGMGGAAGLAGLSGMGGLSKSDMDSLKKLEGMEGFDMGEFQKFAAGRDRGGDGGGFGGMGGVSPPPVQQEQQPPPEEKKPCGVFKLDMTGPFGHCVCGFAKSECLSAAPGALPQDAFGGFGNLPGMPPSYVQNLRPPPTQAPKADAGNPFDMF